MPEPLKLDIIANYDGKAAEQAKKDKEELEKASPTPAGVEAGSATAQPASASAPPARIIDATAPLPRSAAAEAYEATRSRSINARAANDLTASAAAAMKAPAADVVVSPAEEARLKKEAARENVVAAKEASRLEKEISSERRAVIRAQEAFNTQNAKTLGRTGVGLANAVGGSSPFAQLLSSIGSFGGVAGMVGGSLIGAGLGLMGAFARQKDELTKIGLEDATNRRVMSRQLMRHAGFEGSSAGSREQAEAYRDDLTRRVAERGELEHEAEFRWYNPAGWLDKMTGASENKIRRNDNAIDADREGEAKEKEFTYKKFRAEGAVELEADRRRLAGDQRGARDLDYQVLRLRERNRLLREGASDKEANSGADIKVANAVRQEQMGFSRLINARSGAGDVAQVVALATGGIGPNSGSSTTRAVNELAQQMTTLHRGTMAQSAHTTFRQADLRPGLQ